MGKFANTKCAMKVSAAAQGVIDQGDLKQIFDNIDANKNNASIQQLTRQTVGSFVDQKSYEAFNAKRTAIRNLQAQHRMSSTIHDWTGKGLSLSKALEAYSLGTSGHPGIGTRNAAEPRRQSLQHIESAKIASQLRREGLTRYAASGRYDGAIREARWLQNTKPTDRAKLNPTELPKLKPEEQKAVTRVAELMNNQMDYMRELASLKGALIAKREGYSGAQFHDTYKIRNASAPGKFRLIDKTSDADRTAYTSDLAKWIDMEGTRNNLVKLGRLGSLEKLDPQKFLDSLWDVFATGVRKEPRTPGVSYTGNIATEAEKARILEFKSPAAQTAYDQKYGHGSAWEGHLQQIHNMAHTISSLEFFGPSASDNFDKVMNDHAIMLRQKLEDIRDDKTLSPDKAAAQSDAILKQLDDLKGTQAKPYLDAYLGLNRQPGNMTQARVVDSMMALQRMSLLGGSLFSNIPVFWTTALQGNYAGVRLAQGAFRSFFGLLERAGKDDLQTWCRQTGAGTTGLMGQFASHMMEGFNGQPGSIVRNLESKFFNLVGLTPLKDMMASNYVFMVANEMAHNTGNEFHELPGNMQRHLSDYQIGPKEWDITRQHGIVDANGYKLIASDGVRNAPLDRFDGKTELQRKNARAELEAKLGNLFRDSADYATVEPDLKTRMLTPFVNGKRGTISGDLGRLTMQFSTWGFAHGTKVIQRQWVSQSKPQFFAKVAAGLVLTGIISATARQISQGRNPLANPDLWGAHNDAKTAEAWAKLLTLGASQSGVGGMFGDLLFSQTYANGRGAPLDMLGGPLADNVTQGLQFGYDGIFKGKFDGPQMLKYAQGNTPFINTWWIKPIVNYMLMYGFEEQLNPGSLRRMEQASAKAGDPYWLPPSQYATQY